MFVIREGFVMSKFFEYPLRSIYSCKTPPELYSYLFWKLTKLKQIPYVTQSVILDATIEKIKTRIINHTKLEKEECKLELMALEDLLGERLYQELVATLTISCKVSASVEKRWENPFYRNFESQLATSFLLSPTPAMLESTKAISEKIIVILKNNQSIEQKRIQTFLEKISLESKEQEAFGKLGHDDLSLEVVLDILKNNSPADFHHILLIHYSFARYLYRELDNVRTEETKPILLAGVYGDFLKEVKDSLLTYNALENPSKELRSAFIDGRLRKAPFFKDWRMNRGRGFFNTVSSCKMGLMLRKQRSSDLPELVAAQGWEPDALCQEPVFESPYVQETLANDLVYISGPSGMTTLLLGQAELLASLPSVKLKETYALCAAIFIVSGGLHAWHEVLTIAHDLLGYFPQYELGRYQAIFASYSKDTHFQKNLCSVWDNFFLFCDKHFSHVEVHQELKIRYREYFESKLAIATCKQSNSLDSVKIISQTIRQLIETNTVEILNIINTHREIPKELYQENYFGFLHPKKDNAQAILNDLLERLCDESTHLTQVIHIHSVFARHIFNKLEIHQKQNKKLSPIKTNDRGRVTIDKQLQPTYRLGIARLSFFNKKIGLTPQKHLCGIDEYEPDVNSPFYLTMAAKRIPFVSGASGHTVKLISAAKQYTSLSREGLKEYALACFAYLCAGGNHSFHEVLQAANEAGVDYQLGHYLPSLSQAFLNSKQFQVLSKEFPEFLINKDIEQPQAIMTPRSGKCGA
jgi:hypothetical protein